MTISNSLGAFSQLSFLVCVILTKTEKASKQKTPNLVYYSNCFGQNVLSDNRKQARRVCEWRLCFCMEPWKSEWDIRSMELVIKTLSTTQCCFWELIFDSLQEFINHFMSMSLSYSHLITSYIIWLLPLLYMTSERTLTSNHVLYFWLVLDEWIKHPKRFMEWESHLKIFVH